MSYRTGDADYTTRRGLEEDREDVSLPSTRAFDVLESDNIKEAIKVALREAFNRKSK